jgi:hypothetical protein
MIKFIWSELDCIRENFLEDQEKAIEKIAILSSDLEQMKTDSFE